MRRKQLVGRRGAVVVLVALLLTGLVGVLAIVLDGGLLQDNRRSVQAAADAAALAAATELFKNYPSISSNNNNYDPGKNGVTAARNTASANGYTDGGNAKVEVYIPPQNGPFKNKTGYAEVIITYQQPRYFSTIWGSGTIPVAARAVARARWGGTGNGIILLDPTAKDALNSDGTGGMVVTGGASVVVDSNHVEAARATGGGTLVATDFEITGGYSGTLTGIVNTGVQPIADPLAYLPAPSVPPNGTMTVKSLGNGNKQYTLSPGRYNNLPNFNSGDVVIFQQASAGNNGIFYIDGGGFTSTGATIKMDSSTSGGVMIYNNPANNSSSQGISISGNATGSVNLSPLTSGPYAGILLFQNRTATQSLSLSGNGSFDLEGTFYAANAQLQITGNGAATIGSQYISRTMTLGGNGLVTIDYNDNGTARLREVMLVE